MIKIEQLVSYPLKSGSGVTAESLTGGASGIDGDREFCLYRKSDNKFISMRENIRIADVVVVPDGNMLAVKIFDEMFFFDISSTEKNTIRIWSRNVDVTVMPPDVSAFISSVIGEEVVLARLRHPGDYSQSFMDTGPIHIISLAALTSLSLATGYKTLNPLVFRPNIIVPDFSGISEKNVRSLTINGVCFSVTERTERCTAVSLLHRKVHGLDSSALLEKIDEANDYDGALFGLYLQAQARFQLNVGDQVTVS
ncbi:MOSC N-terminal beta barrel domain-containing protein [Pantoea agglomerans]|uniref:MOSC N-terminal beta barrel domain-containing protein n=1 Tax=Enterobacter agglomerans TaxID=549 RepID=UPI00320913E7